MPAPHFDPASLSVDERLQLIDALWQSIEASVARGDADATKAMERWTDTDPKLLADLEKEADEAEADPSSQTAWQDLLGELKQKQE